MKKTEQFKPSETELKGTNLIEASAGTGKTYTIAAIFLRLVLEQEMKVNEILVVTFTEAATGELKDRIRTRLREAADLFSGQATEDPFLNKLLKRHMEKGEQEQGEKRLRDAISDFDESAIFTIHGFCKRMLHENAFESGTLFDTELVADQEGIKREIVEDFWRLHFYDASPLFVRYVIRKTGPSGLMTLLGNRFSQPDLSLIPRPDAPDSSPQEADFESCFAKLSEAWPAARDAVSAILKEDKGLNRNKYRKNSVESWIAETDLLLGSRTPDPCLFDKFEKFTPSGLADGTKKGQAVPSHPFFDLCGEFSAAQQALTAVFETRLMALKVALFEYVRQKMRGRKRASNIQSFDDLLLNLYEALHREGGDTLAGKIREKYRAALIDEFQDTDPVQYDIFKTVFQVPGHVLFLIGDPKQAVYGFRGADIFAYMTAAAHADARYTLGTNWRSDPDLIRAVNTVFQRNNRAFVYEEIPFEAVAAPPEKAREMLTFSGSPEPPLQIWAVNAAAVSGTDKPLKKEDAQRRIVRATASEIARLLEMGKTGAARLDDRPLKPGDIAVLVRRNAEADAVQAALFRRNIASVLYSTGDIFDTREALETEQVIGAIAQPRNERLIRAALVTDMIGTDALTLDALSRDEAAWEKWLVMFSEYRRLWEKHGFIRMFRQFTDQADVLPRLMGLPDGERRATNLLHLGELLHQAEMQKKTGMAGLVKWLSEQRHQTDRREEEHPLRLESDENAVRLVTIHKSKGLEYPVVFCPFTWSGSRSRNNNDPVQFHDEANNRRLTCDLGSDRMADHRILAEKEMLAENLRLLYVALTRARNRCYLVWGRFNTAETSAPAWLLHGSGTDAGDIVGAIEKRFKAFSDTDVQAELEAVRERSGGTIALSPMPQTEGPTCAPAPEETLSLTCRPFSRRIPRDFRVSSFSSLTSGSHLSPDLADYDAVGAPDIAAPETDASARDIFTFPRGGKPGTCLHEIFEHLDFTASGETIAGVVAEKLGKYNFDAAWAPTVSEMVEKVLAAPLTPEIALSRISAGDRISEMGFYFPLSRVTPGRLQAIFRTHGEPDFAPDFPDRIGKLSFSPVQGFMKGFIDMVFRSGDRFYVVDWKSNFLGGTVPDYGPAALKRSMTDAFYVLQYHIYTLALHRYLGRRMPGYEYEKHFGGVFYLFLRGIDPAQGPDFGVFRDRPSPELIRGLERELMA
ncbi:exodeoxyribonuclease V subunit beta [Desulfonema ishimotonii]|uniref:DNA 3'-5' helicase n=1 Tax=Desulfonema ishimotonii TaxID=45657 RepID=A0A401FYM2_9BACT|nr:exodeoxyribonuclease V subunit beta [Desulfonema ishimotonii]GBC62046.1 exodeoxyribonuclease V subunit beta [Desulfonema ishimotonii]